MDKIVSNNDEVYVLKNFLPQDECNKYFEKVRDIGPVDPAEDGDPNLPWSVRTYDVTKDPIVENVTKYLNKRFNLNLKIANAEVQNHHVNSRCLMHIHLDKWENDKILYNSLIYLNDDFDGGEFVTEGGVSIKPEVGMLTFFNGVAVCHGVKKVLKKDRKTIIFWWKL